MELDITKLRNTLTQANRAYSQLVGEEKILSSRKAELESSVGLAKGRLLLKPKVDQYLEEIQAEAHARRVGDLEKLLTALVTEVLPGEAPIGLELEIERGQPSLDIVSRHSADRTEDIYEDEGGAKTNVVSLGLRMVAVVRSGMNRFLMLDESDCWISNKRVPSFYAVLKQAARKIKVQCLAVSHHDIATFGEGITTATLSGHPEMSTGVLIENNPRPYSWTDDEEGIRWIRLRNFQGYIDQTLYMDPGVNALIGENNIGKSSFIRAFRAVFYGEGRDTLIRRGERQCVVEIGFAHGRVLHWNRQSKRNPINIWKYLNADGSVVTEEGMTYETGGRTVPSWVFDIFKIGPVEGLDIHATKQKEPVFLLNKPGSTRAAVLSIGQESGYIRKMITLHKERMAADATTVKGGEVEMNNILIRLTQLETLKAVSEHLERAEQIIEQLVMLDRKDRDLSETASKLERSLQAYALKKHSLNSLARVPEPQILEDLSRAVSLDAQHIETLNALRTTYAHLDEIKKRTTAIKDLPSQLPNLVNNQDSERASDSLASAKENLASTTKVEQTLRLLPATSPFLDDIRLKEDILGRLDDASSRLSRMGAAAVKLREVPGEVPAITVSTDLIERGKAIKTGRTQLEALYAAQNVYASLPSAVPDIEDARQLMEAVTAIGKAAEKAKASLEAQSEADQQLVGVKSELEGLLEEVGHSCPLCSQAINDPTLLLGHVHNEECHHA